MALATYLVILVATYLVTWLGLGQMRPWQWGLYLGLAATGNAVFFHLFRSRWNLRFPDPSLTREQIFYSGLLGLVPLGAMPEARPVLLLFWLPAFSFGMLRLTRRQYLELTALLMIGYAVFLVAEGTLGRDGFSLRYELFLFVLFGILLTWFAVFGGFVSDLRRRLGAQRDALQRAQQGMQSEVEERRKAQVEKDELILELRDALAKVRTLHGLLPICASCKRIRDDQGYWNQIETYVRERSDAEFTHGLCPDCARRLYPGLRSTPGEG